MQPTPDLDPETRQFADYLLNYLNGETDSSSELDEYQLFISGRKDLLEAGEPLTNPVLSTVMPLLSRILHSDRFSAEYASFLSTFLALLPMKATWVYFPQEEMVKAIDYPSPAPLFTATVDLVAWRLCAADDDALAFLNESSFLAKVCSRCLSDHSLTERFWSTETLVMSCNERKLDEIIPDLMHATELVSLQSDYALTFRYVNVAEIVLKRRHDLSKLQYDKILAVVDRDTYFNTDENEPADPLLHASIIQFYARVYPEVEHSEALFQSYQPYIKKLVGVFFQTVKNRVFDSNTRSDEFFVPLSFTRSPALLQWIKTNLPIDEIFKEMDLQVPFQSVMFAKVNPNFVSDKEAFYAKNFAQRAIASIDIPILINIIRSPEFFDLFAKDGKFSPQNLRAFSKDHLYLLLQNITSHQHSATYLLSEMPWAVQEYLIDDNIIINPEIKLNFRSALENLISNDSLDLGVWKEGLKSSRHRIMYGSRRGPQVDVSDEAY